MTLRGLGWKRNGRFRTWANNPALENVPSVSAPLPHKSSHRLPRQCLDSSLDHGENASRVPAENVPHLSPLPFFPPPQGGKPSRRCYSGRACRLPKTTQDGVFPLALIGIIAVRNLSKTLSLPNGDSAFGREPRFAPVVAGVREGVRHAIAERNPCSAGFGPALPIDRRFAAVRGRYSEERGHRGIRPDQPATCGGWRRERRCCRGPQA